MYIEMDFNEYGTVVSVHTCDMCGDRFTLCPAQPPPAPGWENCMILPCESYDEERDALKFFT